MIIEDNTLDSFKARIGAELQGSAIFFKKRIQKDLEDKNINHLNDPSFSFHFEDKHTLNSLFLEFYFTMLPSVGDFATHSFQVSLPLQHILVQDLRQQKVPLRTPRDS